MEKNRDDCAERESYGRQEMEKRKTPVFQSPLRFSALPRSRGMRRRENMPN